MRNSLATTDTQSIIKRWLFFTYVRNRIKTNFSSFAFSLSSSRWEVCGAPVRTTTTRPILNNRVKSLVHHMQVSKSVAAAAAAATKDDNIVVVITTVDCFLRRQLPSSTYHIHERVWVSVTGWLCVCLLRMIVRRMHTIVWGRQLDAHCFQLWTRVRE